MSKFSQASLWWHSLLCIAALWKRLINSQIGIVYSLNDPCLVVCIRCCLTLKNLWLRGQIAASQGLAWAPSYILDCIVMFEGWRFIAFWNSLQRYGTGTGESGIKTNKKHHIIHYIREQLLGSQRLVIISPQYFQISDEFDNVWWILNVINVRKLFEF